jgi:thymidylate kinase
VIQSSPAADFIEHLRRSATSVGALVSLYNGKPSLEQCGLAELSLLLTELHEAGYSIVSSRPYSTGMRLGVMHVTSGMPEFFHVDFGLSSVTLPKTDGLFIAFLGPDGVGKSTTVDRVMARLKPIFGNQHLFHWRPQVLKPRTEEDELSCGKEWTSINRHGDPPRSAMLSLMRLGGVCADYVVGQRRLIRPALDRGELVVFDRYYHDILVDSRRYRYGGPQWLLSTMKVFLPQRRIFFVVLDADEQVILTRKQEVSLEELRSQRRKYADLAHSLHSLHVRTDFGLEQTLTDVLRGIGQHLTHRFDERLHNVEHTETMTSNSAHPATVAKTA